MMDVEAIKFSPINEYRNKKAKTARIIIWPHYKIIYSMCNRYFVVVRYETLLFVIIL